MCVVLNRMVDHPSIIQVAFLDRSGEGMMGMMMTVR